MRSPDFTGTERFELIRPLGEGGFGVVYEAFDRHQSARVALKLLRVGEGASLYRFKREFRALTDVSHPNLVVLHELLTDGGHWFFTMELVHGVPVVAYVRPRNELDEARLREVLAQLTDALTAIHRLGIVHRDIKPSNILVTAKGRVVVLDFGLVAERLGEIDDQTATGESSVVLGTPAYMAPEQVTSDPVTPAADWYSVGVVLYQALTGRVPFTGPIGDVLEAKRSRTPLHPTDVAPDVPDDLADLCMRLLQPDPHDRPSGEAVQQSLSAAKGRSKPAVVGTPVPDVLIGREPHLAALGEAFDISKRGETVVAFISGLSGMGKTALIRYFLHEERNEEPSLLALTSRCYERETMPYKAIDPMVDALARHLKSLDNLEVARLLPRDTALLARVFPVLLQISEVQLTPSHTTASLDSFALRQRAAEALRDLLYALAAFYPLSPLVLTIDDAQWGDADSASILQQVLRPPDAPPLLLIVAYRSEDATGGRLLSTLRQVIRDGPGLHVRDIDVGPLSIADACALAASVTAATPDAGARADAIARESGGNAFFIHELAQHAATVGRSTTLGAVVLERLRTLPDTARRFVTAAAVSAQPITAAVGRRAAELDPEDTDAFQVLRASRLVRTQAGPEEPTYEAYHDRIREAVVSELTDYDLQRWHQRLAAAWEGSPLARPETLVTHFQGAGDNTKTRTYAQIAAQNAEEALAFDRAAEFYRLLVHLEEDRAVRLDWHAKLGEALANTGRGHDAALHFLDALDEPMTDRSIQLERRAATELIRAGYLDQATEVLDRLLPKVGVRAPRSDVRAFATLLRYRSLLRVRGVGFRERSESQIPRDRLRQIDVLMSISEPLCLTSLIRGQALIAQGAWYALRAGEPRRAVRALTGLVASSSVAGTRSEGRTAGLLAATRRQAANLDDPWITGRIMLAEGMVLKLSGRFQRAVEQLGEALDSFAACQGVRWEVETAQNLILDSRLWMGEWSRLTSELPGRRHAAEQRGDLFAAAYLMARTSPFLRLAADRIDDSAAEVTASLTQWTKRFFNLQHRYALCTWIDIDLYTGNPKRADERLTAAWPALRGILFVFQFARIEMIFYRARIALAGACDAAALRRAERDARRLSTERAAWADALSLLIRATVAQARGEVSQAVETLQLAETALRDCHIHHHAAAAQYRRGGLIGGAEGRGLVEAATEWMRHQQIVNPARMVNLLAPGRW
jgi:eukaryotic-like serine/threonine-protein kinase